MNLILGKLDVEARGGLLKQAALAKVVINITGARLLKDFTSKKDFEGAGMSCKQLSPTIIAKKPSYEGADEVKESGPQGGRWGRSQVRTHAYRSFKRGFTGALEGA